MTARTHDTGKSFILYDDALLDHADDTLFAPGTEAAGAGGRGSAWLAGGGEWVLRHYRRGGFAARLSADRYLWTGLGRSRPWREWRLLDFLYKAGLPVPQPVAARVLRTGLGYRGDLLTRRIRDAVSLAERLAGPAPGSVPWRALGACIRRFHDAGVWHADLNAHNLLLDPQDRVYLIDFDRSGRRAPGRGWQLANLARLHRSLAKLGPLVPARGWAELMDGYRSGS